jgi:hypothetical protein
LPVFAVKARSQVVVAASSRASDPTAGDCLTWTAIEASSKLLSSYTVGGLCSGERFIQTASREWAYAQAYPTSQRRVEDDALLAASIQLA